MLSKRFLINWLAIFVTLMTYGFVVYNILLADFFAGSQGSDMMRPAEERMIEWISLASALMAYVFVRIFSSFSRQGDWREGVSFGILMGVFWGSVEFIFYANMPVPMNIALVSFGVDVGMFATSGLVLSLLSSKTTE